MKYYLQMEGKTSGQTVNNIQATPDNVAHLFLGYNSTLGCAKSKSKGNFENYMKIAFH